MIGMFVISEILRWVTSSRSIQAVTVAQVGNVFRGQLRLVRHYWRGTLRSAVVGTGIGALPGAGADIAAWITYAMAKRLSKEPEKFGTGHIEGVAAASTANNASLGGAWIPALVFGIPGDSITAIVIGVLYVKGINPGPTVFLNSPQLIYAIFIVFFLANLLMLPLGWAAIKGARTILSIPSRVLMPVILLFCIVGSFAINNSVTGVIIMLVFGVIGFLMEENDIPIAPAILGLVLGPMLEQNFVTSMIKSQGSFIAFFERPIAAGLGIFTLAIWSIPLVMLLLRRRGARASQ
jgi:TctA family transporter